MLEVNQKNRQLQNVNVIANAIELAASTISKLHSDDVKSKIDMNVLKAAIAARIQRRIINPVK